jgi:hypothetical protein
MEKTNERRSGVPTELGLVAGSRFVSYLDWTLGRFALEEIM